MGGAQPPREPPAKPLISIDRLFRPREKREAAASAPIVKDAAAFQRGRESIRGARGAWPLKGDESILSPTQRATNSPLPPSQVSVAGGPARGFKENSRGEWGAGGERENGTEFEWPITT